MWRLLSLVIIWYSGCCVGSFLTVVGMRIPMQQSIIHPASHCSWCKTKLRAIELFPVFSYIRQHGSCSSCKMKLSYLYPLMEIFTGSCYLLAYLIFSHDYLVLLIAVNLTTFATIFIVSDYSYFLLPNSVMLLFFLSSVLIRITELNTALMGSVSLFFLFFLIALLYPNGLGGGDIKLIGVIGWLLGLEQGYFALLLTCVLSLLYFLTMSLLKREVNRHSKIPFAPFIFIGALSIYFSRFSLF